MHLLYVYLFEIFFRHSAIDVEENSINDRFNPTECNDSDVFDDRFDPKCDFRST